MNSNKKYFFIGIGGIGMSSIARYYNNLGNKIIGYDRVKSDIVEMLSTVWSKSINKPKTVVAKAVEKTIKAPVKALIAPK